MTATHATAGIFSVEVLIAFFPGFLVAPVSASILVVWAVVFFFHESSNQNP